MRFPLSLLLVVAFASLCDAATITVRKDGTGDYGVIQDALDVAAEGDTILIGPGEYTEHSTVRIPAWTWDIEVYANVEVANLTIIGAGVDQTFIGPVSYAANHGTYSPKAILQIDPGDLVLQGVCVRNSYDGLFAAGGARAYIDSCLFDDNEIGITWETSGPGGRIRSTVIRASEIPYSPVGLWVDGAGSGIFVEDCVFIRNHPIVEGVQDFQFRRCEFSNDISGIKFGGGARVQVNSCDIRNMSVAGITFSSSGVVCEITDSSIEASRYALRSYFNARFIVENSRLVGGDLAVIQAVEQSDACEIHNSDLIKGTGPVIVCQRITSLPPVVHDLTGNYWGTSSPDSIAAWIIDGNDDPEINATVLYEPFSEEPLPTEKTSLGSLKALFR